MFDPDPYVKHTMSWLALNIVAIARKARIQNKLLRWGGRFVINHPVPVDTAVVYNGRVFLAVSEKQSNVPEVGNSGWVLIADLHSMKVHTGEWVGKEIKLPEDDNSSFERAVCSRLAQYVVVKASAKAVDEPVPGVHAWKGLFQNNEVYQDGDIVVHENSVYQADPGKGVPGSSDGWMLLHTLGAIGSGPQFLTGENPYDPLTGDDGKPLTVS